ncbi:MAG: peptide chain release factor N(5)-glutamine methyltransferase [Acidobacteriota bacterium]|nr:peptide chain release factor N(5)-glutamine methyltransferase [Acidobacteriota bacterium]
MIGTREGGRALGVTGGRAAGGQVPAGGPAGVGEGGEDRATLRGAIEWAAREIGAASDTARLDAELLLAHVLGRSREQLLVESLGRRGARIEAGKLAALEGLVERRAREREPVAYIVGERHFRRLAMRVDRRALIPRPETELLVEAALELPAGSAVLDLCTGCGAVALAVKDERPDLRVTGSDVSAEALALARENAARLGLEVNWRQADLLEGLADEHDALLCNPPYVAERERTGLAPEIVRHEPHLALFAGEDGLAAIRALTAQLAGLERLRLVAIEVGCGQARAVAGLLDRAGFEEVGIVRDLAGIERVVVGERGRAPG